MYRFCAVIHCADPMDEFGNPRYVREICRRPILSVLAERLRLIDPGMPSVLVMRTHEPRTARLARELGWAVPSPGHAALSGTAAALFRLLKASYWAFFTPSFPFIDPMECRKAFSQAAPARPWMPGTGDEARVLPLAVMGKRTALAALLHRLKRRGNRSFFDLARKMADETGLRRPSINLPSLAALLGKETIHSGLVEYLGGPGLSLSSLRALEADPAFDRGQALDLARDRLCSLREQSKRPHEWNLKLNRFECRHRMSTVRSYPLDVAFNLTTVCNARCVFCSYPAMRKQGRHYYTLDDARQWTWLKYVKKAGFGGGVGDPLTHPQFLSIFRHITETYPHLVTRVITNGIGLDGELCRVFAGNLARLRISLNAATRSTWEALMRSRGFDRVCEHIAYLSDLKRKLGTDKPEIWLLMVMNDRNINEVSAFAGLAGDLGAQVVCYNHFVPSAMSHCELSPGASLYYDRDRLDRELDLAEKKALSSGLKVDRPPPFSARCLYFEACRVSEAPDLCLAPWQICLLAADEEGKRRMSFCCTGMDTRIVYDKADLSGQGFPSLWNHPTLRYFRKTANRNGSNPVCSFCRSHDGEDPENPEIYRVQEKTKVLFERLHERYGKNRPLHAAL